MAETVKLFIASLALVDEGDEAVVPVPYWVTYPEQVKLAGGRPIILHPQDLKITPEELRDAITSRTKLLILNSPSNPTGGVFTADTIKGMVDIAKDNDLVIISDEVYDEIKKMLADTPFSDQIKQAWQGAANKNLEAQNLTAMIALRNTVKVNANKIRRNA